MILAGKIAGAITSVVLMAYGFYSWSKKQGVDEATANIKEVSYEGKIDKLIESDSLKTITLEKLLDNQDSIFKFQRNHLLSEDKQEIRFKTLESSYTDFLQGMGKFKEYIKYLEDTKRENEKKNSMNGSTQ